MFRRTFLLTLIAIATYATDVAFSQSIKKIDLNKPLSVSEKKAVAKYDTLPDDYKEKAITAWRIEYARPSNRKPKLLKNDPPYFPFVIGGDAGTLQVRR